MKNNNGQSTIEFLVTFGFVLAILITFGKIGMNFVDGYLMHYANFQASRAYMTFDRNVGNPGGDDGQAANYARQIFNKYNLETALVVKDVDFRVNGPSNVSKKIFVGTHVSFTQKFTVSNMLGGQQDIELITESFLGRQPTRGECLEQIVNAMSKYCGDCSSNATFFDNGC